MKTRHDCDCTIYASMSRGLSVGALCFPTAGICTCGYGWQFVWTLNWSQMYSEERMKATMAVLDERDAEIEAKLVDAT